MSSLTFDDRCPRPQPAQPEIVFAAQAVTKTYHMGEVEVHALRGVDLELYAGEFVVLLGPSGSGKSTLLNILGGLDVPTSGRVFYRGEELTEFDDAALTRYRRDNVGFVFQFYNLIPSLTARENVALVTDISPQPDESGRRAGDGESDRAAESLSVAALRRRAAARGHRAGRGQESGRAACATNRPARSTSTRASWCSKPSPGSTANCKRPPPSSRTTP